MERLIQQQPSRPVCLSTLGLGEVEGREVEDIRP